MSDNFSAANGGTPVTIATKEVSGVHTPRNLIMVGGQDVASGNPLPVALTFPTTQAVSGPVTDTQLRAAAVVVHVDNQPVQPLTDVQLRAASVTVHMDNPPDQPATDAQLRASALVVHVDNPSTLSQGLTDTQLRATAVPVAISNPLSQGLTDMQLRASAVPVSGPVTDTQLRAAALPVSVAALPLPTGATETNRSGTVTAGSTAQTIMAANASRRYFELQNLSAVDFLWFRKDGSAAGISAVGSFALAPASSSSVGGFYSGQATGAVSVVSVTTGHPFSAVEA